MKSEFSALFRSLALSLHLKDSIEIWTRQQFQLHQLIIEPKTPLLFSPWLPASFGSHGHHCVCLSKKTEKEIRWKKSKKFW